MLPTLQALDELGGSGSIDEIQDRVTSITGLTPQQLEVNYPTSGAAVAPDRMSWARSLMKHGGFVDSGGRGVWLLTDLGREALHWSPDAIRARCQAGYKARKAEKTKDDVEISDGELGKDWTDTLLEHVKGIDPSGFERLSQRILRESGFVKVEVTGKSGDGGIDGTGVLRMNLISFQVLFQCKRYSGSVGASAVRDFRGAMQGRADKGVILTTGTFTPDARKEATRDGAPAIDLINGDALCYLLKNLRLGVAVREIRSEEITVQPDFFDKV